MKRDEQFDQESLAWVRGQIDQALAAAQTALQAYGEQAVREQRQAARQQVHQAYGALALLGLAGVDAFAQGVLRLLDDPAQMLDAATLAALISALGALRSYLDDLGAGLPHQPLRLWPVYRALGLASGRSDLLALDLFQPDLERSLPTPATMAQVADPQLLKAARLAYQKGLLLWLKKPEAAEQGRQQMRQAVDRIVLSYEAAASRSLWQVAQAFFDALVHPQLAADSLARSLCSHLDTRIRRLLEGGSSDDARLLRELLFLLAQAPAGGSPAIAEVHALFGLTALPSGECPPATAKEPVLRELREVAQASEEFWRRFCSGQSASLADFAQQVLRAAQLAHELGNTDLRRLTQGLSAVVTWLVEAPSRHRDGVAMEVATAVLLLQNAQAQFHHLDRDFAPQVDRMVDRLHACMAGRIPVSEGGPAALDEMSRRAQEKLLINQVSREMHLNLARVEQVLDGYFRAPENPAELVALEAPLRQVAGALTMLGHLAASAVVQGCLADVRQLQGAEAQPALFAPLAERLSLVGFFVDALSQGAHDFAAFAQRLQPARSQPVPVLTAPPPATEAPVAVEAASAAVSPVALDRELLAVFLAEAREVLADLGSASLSLSANPADRDALLALRRATHTLKGSGRMLGLHALAAQAGEVEEIYQAWLAGALPEPLACLELAAEELRWVGAWVAYLEQPEQRLPPDAAALQAVIARLLAAATPASTPETCATPADEHAPVAEQNTVADEHANLPPEVADEVVDAGEAPVTTALAASAAPTAHETLPLPSPDPHLQSAAAALADLLTGHEPAAAPTLAPEDTPPLSSENPSLSRSTVELDKNPQATVRPLRTEAPGGLTISISATLYDIFRIEAREHLETLAADHADLVACPLMPTPFEMARAAHTLGGIAATVGLLPLNHLALALERALLRRHLAVEPACRQGLEILRQAIVVLDEMYVAAGETVLEEQSTLIAALDEIFPPELPDSCPDPELLASDALPLTVEGSAVAAANDEQAEGEGDGEGGVQPECPPVTATPTEETADTPCPPAAGDGLEASENGAGDEAIDPQLLALFLDEASEQLPELAGLLRSWRQRPDDPQLPQAIARLLHTFKGNARMAGVLALGDQTHRLESQLEAASVGGNPIDARWIETFEAECDALAQATERWRSTEGGGRWSAAAEPVAIEAAMDAPAPTSLPAPQLPEVAEPVAAEGGEGRNLLLRVRAEVVDRLVGEAGELSINRGRVEEQLRHLKTSTLDLTENVARLRAQLREIEIQAETRMPARVANSGDGGDFDPLELDRFSRFQELTRFMAESVDDVATVQQNLLRQLDEANVALLAQARLHRDLQQALLGIRMLPFASQEERLHRVVRQTARASGKRTRFEICGADVEVDRSVLDRMLGPIEHMLRNAVVHGIEASDERQQAGKDPIGSITLTLAQEGNEIVLTLADDGRGLDATKIRAQGEALGLLAASERVTAECLNELIFAPGFSTADALTSDCGRGVGMDVVKTEVTALGGRIEIDNRPGQGCRFRIYLPLTLAVTPTVLVRVGKQSYAIPAALIEQALELKREEVEEIIQAGEVNWQDRVYPVDYLPRMLGNPGAHPEQQKQNWLLLLRSGTQRLAVLIDALLGNQEVVVKHIGEQLARVPGISGATVLADGQIVLILNPVALAGRQGGGQAPLRWQPATAQVTEAPQAAPGVLVVDDSLTVRRILARLLVREGYTVWQAKDGAEALALLAEKLPVAVLCDIEMPRMDGFECLRQIRADARLAGLPVVMITSRTADKHRQHALELGANAYLGKPYVEEELLRLLAAYRAAASA